MKDDGSGGEVERIRGAYAGYAEDVRVKLRWDPTNPGMRAIGAELRSRIATLLASNGWSDLSGMRLLDVGCGDGGKLALFVERGISESDVSGVDLREGPIEKARVKYPRANFWVGDATQTGLAASSHDIVLSFTVFSSILQPNMRSALAGEMLRVLKPDGIVVFYDFRVRHPMNPHVRGVTRREIRNLFPRCFGPLERITVLPPLARHLGEAASFIYPKLSRIPMLNSHYLGLLRKSRD